MAILAAGAGGAELKKATVVQTVNDVRVIAPNAADRPAKGGDAIAGELGVKTGSASRAELEFQDRTLTRLGANTIFNFEGGTRQMEMAQGTMLLQVPKNAGGAKIRTAAVTAAITGTTILLEYEPDRIVLEGGVKKKKKGSIKVIVLEGTLQLSLNDGSGSTTTLNAGQMLVTSPDTVQLPSPVQVDLQQIVNTSLLANNAFWPREGTARPGQPGGGLSMELITPELEKQAMEKAKGTLAESDLSNAGGGLDVMTKSYDLIAQLDTALEAQDATSERVTLPPNNGPKTGALPAVVPGTLTIDGSTIVQLDPLISGPTGNVEGRIYRGDALDGSPASFAYGVTSPSAFDTMLGLGSQGFFVPGLFPTPGVTFFKFDQLSLGGTPNFIVNGGPTTLALIGTNGIGTATSGGLSFASLSDVFLSTQTASIVLNAGFTITGGASERLGIYARGAGGDLTNGAQVSGFGRVGLAAEHDLTQTSAGRMNAGTSASFVAGRNLTLDGILSAPVLTMNALAGALTLNPGAINYAVLTSLNATAPAITLTGNLNTGTLAPAITFNAGAGGFNAAGFTLANPARTVQIRVTGGAFSAQSFTGGGLTLSGGGAISVPGTLDVNTLAYDGSLNVGALLLASSFAGSAITASSVTLSGPNANFTASGNTTLDALSATGNITIGGFLRTAGVLPAASRLVSAGGNISITGDAGNPLAFPGAHYAMFTAGGNIDVGTATNALTLYADTITAGGAIRAGGIISESISAGIGGVTTTRVLNTGRVSTTGGVAVGSVLYFNSTTGTAYSLQADGVNVSTELQFRSDLPLTINTNGITVGGRVIAFVNPGQNGGSLTLNATGTSFSAPPTGDLFNFSGGDAASAGGNAGNGGVLTLTIRSGSFGGPLQVVTSGDFSLPGNVVLNGGSASGTGMAGAGGAFALTADGIATIAGRVSAIGGNGSVQGVGGTIRVQAGANIVATGTFDTRGSTNGAIMLRSLAGSVLFNNRIDGGTFSARAGLDIALQSSALINLSGPIDVNAGRDLLGQGGSIFTSDPNVTVTVGRDLSVGFFGARTFTIGRNASLNGTFSFETATIGGSLTTQDAQAFLHPGNTSNAFTLSAGSIQINGNMFFENQSATLPPAKLTLTTTGSINIAGSIFVGVLNVPSGDAGVFTIANATNVGLGTSLSNLILLSGGDAIVSVANGGNGGRVIVTNSGSFTLNSALYTNGGNALANGTGVGGNGGSVTITSGGALSINGDLRTFGGGNGIGATGFSRAGDVALTTTGGLGSAIALAGFLDVGRLTLNSSGDIVFAAGSTGTATNFTAVAGRDYIVQPGAGSFNVINATTPITITAGRDIIGSNQFVDGFRAGRDLIGGTLSARTFNIGGNLTASGNLIFDTATIGGVVTAAELDGLFAPANATNTITLTAGSVNVSGGANFQAPSSVLAAPNISLAAIGVLAIAGNIDVAVPSDQPAGRNNGTLTLSGSAVTIGGVTMYGAAPTDSTLKGGRAGTLNVTNTGSFTLNGPAFLTGGNAIGTGNGGAGGAFNVTAGSIVLNGDVFLFGGGSPMGSIGGDGSLSLTSTTGDSTIGGFIHTRNRTISAARDLILTPNGNFTSLAFGTGTITTGRDFSITLGATDQSVVFANITVGRDFIATNSVSGGATLGVFAPMIDVTGNILFTDTVGQAASLRLQGGGITAGGFINVSGDLAYTNSVTSGGPLTVGGNLVSFGINTLSTVTAPSVAISGDLAIRNGVAIALFNVGGAMTIAGNISADGFLVDSKGLVNLPGGGVTIDAASLTLGGTILARGLDGVFDAPYGANGGRVILILSGNTAFLLSQDALLTGGNADQTGTPFIPKFIGNGGMLSISNGGSIVIAGTIDVRQGDAFSGAPNAPAGGAITLVSTGGDISLALPLAFSKDFVGTLTLNAGRDLLFSGSSGDSGAVDFGGFFNASYTAGRDITSDGDVHAITMSAGRDVLVLGSVQASTFNAGRDVVVGGNFGFDEATVGGNVSAGSLSEALASLIGASELAALDPQNLPNVRTLTLTGTLTVSGGMSFPSFPAFVTPDNAVAPYEVRIVSQASALISLDSTLDFRGGATAGTGQTGPGGTLAINTPASGGIPGPVTLGQNFTFYSHGGDSTMSASIPGGPGGNLRLFATGNLSVGGTAGDVIDVSGGDSLTVANGLGGNGGSVDVFTTGNLTLTKRIIASSGEIVHVGAPGGNGGNVTLHAEGLLDIQAGASIETSGSDEAPGPGPNPIRSSLIAGNVSLAGTSPAVSIPALRFAGVIQNNLSDSAQALGGLGGMVTLLSKGGDIQLRGGSINNRFGATVITAPPADVIVFDGTAIDTGTLSVTAGAVIGTDNNVTPTGIVTYTVGTGGMSFAGNIGDSLAPEATTIVSDGSVTTSGGLYATSVAVNGVGSDVNVVGDINIAGGSITVGRDLISSGGNIQITQHPPGTFGNISAGRDIFAFSGLFTPGTPATVTAGRNIFAPGLITGAITATTGDITIDNTAGSFAFGLIANSITAGGSARFINSPTIGANNGSAVGSLGITPDPLTFTAVSIISSGPIYPILSGNGSDSGFIGIDNPGNGGSVTLNLTGSLLVNSNGDLAAIKAHGGAASVTSNAGGDGGSIVVNTGGDFSLGSSGLITASTSAIAPGGAAFLGNGGSVTINSGGTVDIAATIEASSDDPSGTPPPPPRRLSASGGNISVKSTRTGGTAIRIQSTAQLNALLNASAPGPGGKITIVATGAGSNISVAGRARADRGTVEVRHDGPSGTVNTTSTADLRGDIVKIGALGSNGVLTIAGGSFSADTTLKLYATGSSGQVVFAANTALLGNSLKYIAGQSVTINNSVQVNVGGPTPAQVFTNVPNYTGSGGNGSTTGIFTGQGATTSPLGGQPGF